MKEIFQKLKFIVVALCATATFVTVPSAGAVSCDNYDHFMGFPAWYDGLSNITGVEVTPGDGGKGCVIKAETLDESRLSQFIWTIALNIVTMLLMTVGYVAVLLVIYGGFQYMTSRGNPAKAAAGKKTITNALIGAVICAVASVVSNAIKGIASDAIQNDGKDFFVSIANTAILWAGIVAVVMIVIGGIYYASSDGDPGKITNAKNTILYAVIGLILAIASAAIVNFVFGALQ